VIIFIVWKSWRNSCSATRSINRPAGRQIILYQMIVLATFYTKVFLMPMICKCVNKLAKTSLASLILSGKVHFSPPVYCYTNELIIIHVCFNCQWFTSLPLLKIFLKRLVWHAQVLRWSSNGTSGTWQARNHHTIG